METSSYVLTAYSFIFSQTLEQILDCGYQSRDGNPIPSFDENLLINLCSEAKQIFETEPNLLKLEGDFIIVGDLHGSLHDLLRIIKFIHENNSKVLFLGDYVDRGSFSLECLTLLFALKIMQPNSFFLLRGNHEFDQLCSLYGFKDEILNYHDPKKIPNNLNQQSDKDGPKKEDKQEEYCPDHSHIDCYKYSEKLYDAFVNVFTYLPISAILNDTTFCIHGGLSPNFEVIDQIDTLIHRPVKTFEENSLLTNLVWGDPSHGSTLFDENPRGRGYLFNGETIRTFLRNNSLVRMIRAHQCVRTGILSEFNDKIITVFSASSYDKLMGNSSSILQLFQKDDILNAVTFLPIRRLQKSETVFYKVQRLDSESENNHAYITLIHPTLFQKPPPIRKILHKNFIPILPNNPAYQSRRNSEVKLSTPLAKSKFTTKPRKSYQFDQKSLLPLIGQNESNSNNNNSAP